LGNNAQDFQRTTFGAFLLYNVLQIIIKTDNKSINEFIIKQIGEILHNIVSFAQLECPSTHSIS
jgi:hypothetical protein